VRDKSVVKNVSRLVWEMSKACGLVVGPVYTEEGKKHFMAADSWCEEERSVECVASTEIEAILGAVQQMWRREPETE
jgi:hypothetical protein